MALNKKIRDELNAVKGLDSSSVYDEEDQKKKKAAQMKQKAEAAKKNAQATKKAGTTVGAGLKTGSSSAKTSTKPKSSVQKKDDSEFFKNLRETLQGRLKEYRATKPAATDLSNRYTAPNTEYETDVAGRRKDLLTGNVYNAQKGLDNNNIGVYNARQTVQDLKGLAVGTKNNAQRAENWEAESKAMGNNILGNWYGSAKETLDRLAGQMDSAVGKILSPDSRQREAQKEEDYAGLLKYFTDLNWGSGERKATQTEMAKGSAANQREIMELEAKEKNGSITSDERFLLDTLRRVQKQYDSGEVKVYDNNLDETAAGRLAAQDAYMQTRANVDYMGRQAESEIRQMRADATVESVLEKMDAAGVNAQNYSTEREALYNDYMQAGALETFFGNRGKYKLLNYTPEQYAAYRWTEDNEPENLEALEEFLDVRANAQVSKDAQEYWGDPNRKDGMNNIVGNTVLGLVGRVGGGIMHTVDLAGQALAVAGGTRNEIDYGRLNAASVGGEAAVSAQAQKLAELGSLSDLIEGLDGTWLGKKNLGDLYRNGVDSAASILNGMLFGAGTGVATTSQVYSSAYTDAKERGASDGQAGLFAAFQSAAEGVGEQVSFGSFQNLIVSRGVDKRIGGKILLGIFQSAEEAGQELVTEAMNKLADDLVMQELSEEEAARQQYMAYGYDPETAGEMAREEANERLLDAALGGLIGGVIRSGSGYAGEAVDAGITAAHDYAAGRAIQKNNNAGIMAQLMSEVSGQEVTAETSKRKLGKQQREFLGNAAQYLENADDATLDVVYGKINDVAQASQKALEGTAQAVREKADKRVAGMQISDAGASVGGESVTVQGFVRTAGKNGDARLNIRKADGTNAEADIADITFDRKSADVYSYAADMATPELANTFRMSLQPEQMGSIERVANGYSQAYDMAKAGYKLESVQKSVLTDALTAEQVQRVYDFGVNARKAEQEARIAEATERAQAIVGKAWKGGTVDMGNVNYDTLTDVQRENVDVASAITGMMGINVAFYESATDAEGRYKGANGSYNRRTNTIYLDVNAGRSRRGDSMTQTAILKTLSHEITHAIQRNSPEIYAQLRDSVADILGDAKGTTLDDLVAAKMAKDKSLTGRDAAVDEVVADACEAMLKDSGVMQRLQELHPEAARSFIDRVREVIGRIREAIKALYKGRGLSREAQLVMQDVERYEELVRIWEEGAVQTAEVSGSEYAETEASEDENTAISEETADEGENITSEQLQARNYNVEISYEQLEKNVYSVVKMDNVITLRGDEMPFGDGNLKRRVLEFFDSIDGKVYNNVLGDVELNNRSLRDERGHGMYPLKALTFYAVPDVIGKGEIINYSPDWEGRKYRTYIIAAPIGISAGTYKGNYWMGVIVKADANMQNLYTHDVVIVDKKDSDTLQTGAAAMIAGVSGGTKSSLQSILEKLNYVNPDIQNQTRDQTQSPEFERWFKGSKIVNEDGSPKVMYHGTPYGGFTVFKDWQYFTDSRDYADVYQSPNASMLRSRHDAATNPMTYAVYLKVKKPFDTRDPKIRRIWQEEFYDNYSRTPLSDKGLPDWTDGIDLVEFIEDNEYDYDAIILDEGAVGGYGDDVQGRGISVVVRNSNQVKSATDNIGTFDPDDPDIQHQTREEAISTRLVLANMLEADATDSEEKAWLQGYRGQLNELEMVIDAIEGNRRTVRELMFKKGRTAEETERLTKARNRIKILQEQVTRMDEGLLNLEKADVIRSLVAREERKIREREAEKRREGIAKVMTSQRNSAIRKNIQRRAKRLDRMLRQPTDKDHIPESLKDAMLELMQIFVGNGPAFGGSKADVIRAYRAQQEYEAMRSDEDNPDLASRFDEDTAERLRQLGDLMKDKDISDFDNAELTKLSMVIEHFEHLVRDQNEVFADSRRKKTEGYAERVWQQTMTMKGRKENAITANALVKALKHMGHANVIPPYFYKHLGGAMGELGNDMLKAEGKYGVNMNKAAQRLEEIRDKYEHQKWATVKGDILALETEIGDRLELTREQALGIWASAKRERLNTVQRAAHLRDGGVILEKSARKLGMKGQEINVTPTKLSQRDIQQIDNWLTDQQKKYADAMVGYISHDMAALGNETSMELAGYKKFGEGYYYPYKTSGDFRRTELGKVENALIKNMGFTKSVVRNAKTPVVITDFSATVADHVNAMLMYNAFAVTQDQLMRVYDFKLDDSNSVKNLLRNAFGDEVPAYIEQHMRDIYGGVSPDRDAGLVNWLVGAQKKQAVLGSLSVVIQQPTALVRAMSQVNPKYFIGEKIKGGYSEAMEYAGTAVIKDIGGFDSGVGRGATDWLNGSPRDWRNRKVKSALDTVSDIAGMGAEYADKVAWTAIWKAVKREQAAKYKLDIDSAELKEIAGERFDEVVRLTQVYDSVMTRSQLMRNKNVFWKMATSFMSEPTVTWNMLYDAGIEAFKNKRRGTATGILASVLASTILTNLAKAIVTAARDDDDEEATYLERYAKNATEGMINDAVLLNYMPIARDIYSALQGYDVERADMGIINDILAAGEVMLNEDKAPAAKVESLVQLMSIMTGVPGKNIWRDVEAVFNTINATPQSEAREGWLRNALRTGAIDATPIGKWFDLTDNKANNIDRLFDAALDGDSAGEAELRRHIIDYNNVDDDKAVDSLLRTRIKNGYTGGEIDRDEAMELLTGHAGMRARDAEKKINEWSYSLDNDGQAYTDLKDRFLAGEVTADEAVTARTEYGGMDEEAARATVNKWQYQLDSGGLEYDDMKDDYLDGEISDAEAIEYRVKYGGVKRETAEDTVGKWRYEKEYGYAYEDLSEEYALGNVTGNEAQRAMVEYGGKDENSAYWTVAEWDYEISGGEWNGKTTLLDDAFRAGNSAGVRARMTELAGHSDWKKPGNELASCVTNYYKPIFEAAGTEQKRQLQPIIMDYIQMAYEAVGEEYYGDKNTLRYRSWLKID